jgi:hypothetical protein
MENSYAEGIAVSVEKAVGVAILRRRQFYADNQFCGLSGLWPTPTASTFGRRRRRRPSAYCAIPVVSQVYNIQSTCLSYDFTIQKVRRLMCKLRNFLFQKFVVALT